MFCCKVKITDKDGVGKDTCLLLSQLNRIDFKLQYGSNYECPNSAGFAKFSSVILVLCAMLFF